MSPPPGLLRLLDSSRAMHSWGGGGEQKQRIQFSGTFLSCIITLGVRIAAQSTITLHTVLLLCWYWLGQILQRSFGLRMHPQGLFPYSGVSHHRTSGSAETCKSGLAWKGRPGLGKRGGKSSVLLKSYCRRSNICKRTSNAHG